MKKLKLNFKIMIELLLALVIVSCKNTTQNVVHEIAQETTYSNTQETQKIKQIEYYLKKDNTKVKTEFFDVNGNKTKLINHSKEYGDSKTAYSYNKNNRLITEKKYNTKEELESTKFFENIAISDQEFIESIYLTDKSGIKKLREEVKLENNDLGYLSRKIKKTVFGTWVHNYKYHANSKLKEETIIGFDETEKVIITYNKKGLRIEEKIFRITNTNDDFKLELTNNWYYDANGDQVTKNGKAIIANEIFLKKYSYYK